MKFTIKTTEPPKTTELANGLYEIEFYSNMEDFFSMLDNINPLHIENYIKNKIKKPFSLTNRKLK